MRNAIAVGVVVCLADLAAVGQADPAVNTEERAALAERVVAAKESPGREFPRDYRAALVRALQSESLEQLQQRETSGNIVTQALGDTNADLTYTPFNAPCRIIDTRTVGGPLPGGSPGAQRGFYVAGTAGFNTQGGTIGGCGIPVGATAVLINFVAVNPQGIGNLRRSAYGYTIPTTGSILNYQSLTPVLNIANGLLFPICNPAINTCSVDIVLAANGAGTDLVADVLGYARRFATETVKPFRVSSSFATTNMSIPVTCAHVPGLTVSVTAPVDGTVKVELHMMLSSGGTGSDNVFIHMQPASDVCDSSNWGVDATMWNTGWPITEPLFVLARTYPITAGTTMTFYENVNRNSTTGSASILGGSGIMIAEFTPN